MNDNLQLPPRAPMTPEVRDRIRASVAVGLAEPVRPGRRRLAAPLAAAAAGVVALGSGMVVLAQHGGGSAGPAAQPTATAEPTGEGQPDEFTAQCIDAAAEQTNLDGWAPGAAATAGDQRLIVVRTENEFAACVGSPASIGDFDMLRAAPDGSDGGRTTADPLRVLAATGDTGTEAVMLVGGQVMDQTAGMTLTFADGTTAEAEVANASFAAQVPRPPNGENPLSLVESVRIVDGAGTVLYEGPLEGH